MLKLSDKQHVIWTQGMEKEVKNVVEKLSQNFSDVSHEIVPYKQFANGEVHVILNESVREKWTHMVNILDPKRHPSSPKFNDLLIHDLLIRLTAKTHGARWISVDTIPFYDIKKQLPSPFSQKLPNRWGAEDFWNDVFNIFEERKRMFPRQQERIHLVGTQDTAEIVNSMQQYLIQELWAHTVSSEISLYDESPLGLTRVGFQEPVENKHVYVVGDVNGYSWLGDLTISYNDRLMQMFLLAHKANKYHAKTINFVSTCFPYWRQDKPIQWGLKERVTREPSSAQFMTDIIQNYLWVDYCLTMDMHNPAVINNSNQTNFVNLYTWRFVQHVADILKKDGKDQVILAPMDEWGLKKISSISKDLGMDHITVLKKRNYTKINSVDEIFVHGDIEGKDILIHDDILDTWWSLIKLIEKLHSLKARSINVVITHGMFNKDALQKLQALHAQWFFENIYVTNTIARDKASYPDFVKTIDASKNFADPIKSIYLNKSINYNFWVQAI